MSSHIIASFQPAKERSKYDNRRKRRFLCDKKRVLEDKLRRIQLCVTTLESINDKWFTYTQQIVTMKRREEEEEKYKTVTEGDQGIFQLLHKGKEAVITLTMHKDEVDQNLKQLSKELTNKQTKEEAKFTPSSNINVYLPHLSLPTFDGDPRQWRQFWSSFNAAVHTQAIPEIQKLNYLYSCLKGKALQAISGYDIAPENYEVIRKLLNEKYGDHSIVTTLLYNELQSIKRNEREWIGTIENIERVLRQLEALGESLEHSNIEILIKSKNCQHSLTQLNIKSTTTKPEQKQRYNPGGTSALSSIKDNQNTSKTTTTKRRPCVFCNQDHWDSDCVNYTTLNARLSRLKVLKKCTICLRDSHKGQNCNVKKQCFYCKSSHNSALCNKRNSLSLNNTMSQRNEEHERIGPSKRKDCSTSLYNSTLTTRSKQTKETLLLCKEIKVFNPSQPQLQQNTLALFDIGSQLSFISKKLSRQLKLTETETQIMRIAPFGMKEPKSCPTARIQLNVLTTESEIIPLQANIIDYLTNELQVVETSNEFQIQNLTNYWKKPDVLIGADYFFKFISLREIRKLKSGHMLVQSKVGPMIAGSGDIKKLCKNELYPKEVVYSTNVNISTELEKFWKLETIGIQESPQDDDDDQALKHFKRTIIKQGGRYQVCLPWKDSKQKLSNNYGLCLGRLKNLINRLQHNSNLHSYHQILMDQLHSGIIEEVPPKDEVGVIHYLPHHEVLTPK
uniref:DUF1758 domain-containing protein n=1 Tax=Brugia malayi TaxID=6279 RepID=A8PH52_BRUMA